LARPEWHIDLQLFGSVIVTENFCDVTLGIGEGEGGRGALSSGVDLRRFGRPVAMLVNRRVLCATSARITQEVVTRLSTRVTLLERRVDQALVTLTN
jgi:hypothetical protein